MRGRVPHGVAGMLVVLFALAGVAFSYGMGGHAPPYALCVVHAAASADDPAAGSVLLGPDRAHLPLDLPGPPQDDVCLSLAVLLTLMVLALASAPRPAAVRPRRFGWTLGPPSAAIPRSRSLAVLQVLRL
ncbi:hypothetical protein [Thermomonospora umbrina]|uniref:Uncharacterized protein n=1 Tax=Thermomonospora umbrina TaxID=111806 RepID=A0A3D9SNZ7_9ACTN|nr:hypothetical protein [Thermomonospora umbrina]REE94665.1 hypothetical protein DFJ69_0013 [Thermomonospora umbrina]